MDGGSWIDQREVGREARHRTSGEDGQELWVEAAGETGRTPISAEERKEEHELPITFFEKNMIHSGDMTFVWP
jgi:hypothetical protein